jgi:hypothetical protein
MRGFSWLAALCAIVAVSSAFLAPPSVASMCGNGVVDADEECDTGGFCAGGSNAGTACTADTDCPQGICKTFGGQGCAANCTLESDVPFPLVPGMLSGLSVIPGTSGAVIDSDFLSIPLPLTGNSTLTVGKAVNGKIPFVIKASSIQYPGVPVSTLACGCLRGMAAKTCGGTYFEPDGVTLALDCTPGFTAGDTVCTAAGKPPCAFVHGAGNTVSGEIGCDGEDNVDVSFAQDSGGSSGIAQPPLVQLSGHGGPGSATGLGTAVITAALGSCTGSDPSTYGPDGVFCTADDPPGGLIAVEGTVPAVTGTATAVVHNANGCDGCDLGPVQTTGAPFDCSAVALGNANGAGFVQALDFVHLDTVGDVTTTAQQFIGIAPPAPPNDDCSTPTVIGALPFTDQPNTAGATTATTDPTTCFVSDTKSVWYSYTPSSDGTIQVDTTGSSYAPEVGIFTGGCDSLTSVECHSYYSSSQFRLPVSAGVPYLFEVTDCAYCDGGNGGLLQFTVTAVVPPSNDECAGATVAGTLPFTNSVDTRSATSSPSDPPSCSGSSNTVWYSFTPSISGSVQVDTSGSDYCASVSAYTGVCGALTQLDCFYGCYSGNNLLHVTAGVPILLEVADAYGGDGGHLAFQLQAAHDSVVRAPGPKTFRIGRGRTSVRGTLHVTVINADVNDPPAGHAITLHAYDTCGAVIGAPDFDAHVAGYQDTVTVAPGRSRTADVAVEFSFDRFTSPTTKAPDRCEISFSVSSPTVDPSPNNNSATMEVNVIDENDF